LDIIPQIRRGRRLKKFVPKIIIPKIIDIPPRVNETGYPANRQMRTAIKNSKGINSITIFP
jgi:hypothetical protein